MSLAAMLQQTGAIESMARELNIDQQTARTGAMALLPAIVAGMGRTTSGSQGIGGLGGLIGGLGGGGLLESVLGAGPTNTSAGNDILGSIFGSKDTSRGVAGEVAAATGIDEGLLKKMLPILAMAAVGYLAKQASANRGAAPGGAGVGSGVGMGTGAAAGAGGLGGILGSIIGGLGPR